MLPIFRDHPLTLNAGWYRQQLVKLCAANLSKTEFFITFDSDIILTKPICVADIVRDGKALLEPEDPPFIQAGGPDQEIFWVYPWICLPPARQSPLLFFRVPSAVDNSNTWKIPPTKPGRIYFCSDP